MIIIESLEIDDHILEKIETKHNIFFCEVEEACLSTKRHVRRAKGLLYKVFSQTDGGRYVLVVLVNLEKHNWKIVTAREMTENEKRLYIRETGGK